MRTLRLLLFAACNRDCDLCCNKDWDLKVLPVVRSFEGYDEILLTGGEPMLSPRRIRDAVKRIRAQTPMPKIYLYTAMVRPELLDLLRECLDGVTLTLHEQSDITPAFLDFLAYAPRSKSLRLNVFASVKLPNGLPLDGWKVKSGIEWIPNCPLPENETFGRIA